MVCMAKEYMANWKISKIDWILWFSWLQPIASYTKYWFGSKKTSHCKPHNFKPEELMAVFEKKKIWPGFRLHVTWSFDMIQQANRLDTHATNTFHDMHGMVLSQAAKLYTMIIVLSCHVCGEVSWTTLNLNVCATFFYCSRTWVSKVFMISSQWLPMHCWHVSSYVISCMNVNASAWFHMYKPISCSNL